MITEEEVLIEQTKTISLATSKKKRKPFHGMTMKVRGKLEKNILMFLKVPAHLKNSKCSNEAIS